MPSHRHILSSNDIVESHICNRQPSGEHLNPPLCWQISSCVRFDDFYGPFSNIFFFQKRRLVTNLSIFGQICAALPWRKSIRVQICCASCCASAAPRERASSAEHAAATQTQQEASTAWDLLGHDHCEETLHMLSIDWLILVYDQAQRLPTKTWEVQTANSSSTCLFLVLRSLSCAKEMYSSLWFLSILVDQDIFLEQEGYLIISTHLCLFSLSVINIFWRLMAELAWNLLCTFTLPPVIITIRPLFGYSYITNMSAQCWGFSGFLHSVHCVLVW